jgi:hypothetical protein
VRTSAKSLELLAAQQEAQLSRSQSLAQPLLGLAAVTERVPLVLVRGIDAAVPDDDVARAILLLGNHALERCVVERVVLDLDREALVRRDPARGPWARPTT